MWAAPAVPSRSSTKRYTKSSVIGREDLFDEPQFGRGLERGSLRLLKFREDTGDLGGGDRSAERRYSVTPERVNLLLNAIVIAKYKCLCVG